MSEALRLVYATLVADTVDTSANNPCLLTLINRGPARSAAMQPAGKIGALSATTLNGAVAAGSLQATLAAIGAIKPGHVLWLADGVHSPEAVQVADGGVAGNVVTFKTATLYAKNTGALVSGLPTSILQADSRIPVPSPDYYPMIVLGPWHEWPTPTPRHRAPVRLYEGMLTVSVFDSGTSRKLADDIADRLDFLVNLGEAGCNGNATPLFGGSPASTGSPWDYIESSEMVEGPDPHFDYPSLSTGTAKHFRLQFSRIYT